MKRVLFILVLNFFANIFFAQDIDFYLKDKNSNYNFPEIPEEMNFKEFYLLSQTFRMQDMIYASIVPGYIHFKAQENFTGYSLIAVRGMAITTIAYEYFKVKKISSTFTLNNLFDKTLQDSLFTKTDKILVNFSILSAISTYIFDIIHGKYILEKKQEYIRFKYSPKISLTPSFNFPSQSWSFAFSIQMNL